jgi:hypothetical protein
MNVGVNEKLKPGSTRHFRLLQPHIYLARTVIVDFSSRARLAVQGESAAN